MDQTNPSDASSALEATGGEDRPRKGSPGWRLAVAGVRTRILLVFVGLLAVATLASVFVAREVLYLRLDERIDDELNQEASELRRLAASVDPSTDRPLGENVRRLFTTYFERNTPSRGEALLTFVDGSPFLRSRQVESFRLDEDPALTSAWGGLSEPERDAVETPAGRVEYLAVPLKRGEDVLGVFVVTQFREVQQGPFDDAIVATGAVGLSVLLIGSILAWFMAERVLRPVRALTEAAHGISESDLTQRIEVRGHDELADLAQTFNAMLDRLERAFASQRQFLDDAGHELRTPLTIVRGHLELLEDDPRERRETLALVLDELDRMGRMVNDLLLLAKADQPRFLHFETVDVASLTTEVFTKAAAIEPRQWMVEESGRGRIVADPQRLTQALLQLAQNAVDHTTFEDEVALGSAVTATEARFWIRDSGPGIPWEEQATVFDRFDRGADGDRREGAGLGLSIVKAIATAHRGRVDLRSRPGAGATFTLVLPTDQPHPEEA
jgi:signal transduction histidine kinase